jgi:hypothetical protein
LKKEGKVCTLALTCILKYNKTEMDIIWMDQLWGWSKFKFQLKW